MGNSLLPTSAVRLPATAIDYVGFSFMATVDPSTRVVSVGVVTQCRRQDGPITLREDFTARAVDSAAAPLRTTALGVSGTVLHQSPPNNRQARHPPRLR